MATINSPNSGVRTEVTITDGVTPVVATVEAHWEPVMRTSMRQIGENIKKAVREGHTVCIVGDNSESGFYAEYDAALIPTYDIPPEYIDENARQLRFSNQNTTDDHAIHIVGYLEKDRKDWYLIKDSGAKSRNGHHEGYMFYREDFVKLKMMNILLHKDVVEDIINKVK